MGTERAFVLLQTQNDVLHDQLDSFLENYAILRRRQERLGRSERLVSSMNDHHYS